MMLNRHKHRSLRHIRSFEEESTCTRFASFDVKVKKKGKDQESIQSSLPGSTLRMHVELLGKPRDVNKRSRSLPKVNLISKDTHLVFSIKLAWRLPF